MTDTNDSTTQQGSPDPAGSSDTGTPADDKGTTGEDPVALARKRQAGAEAARQKAEEARDAALKELEQYRAKERTASEADLADNAKLKERLEAAERRAAEAEAKAEGRILDIKYPRARAELPEITDEVRLAKLEALLSDDVEQTPPPPQNPNANNHNSGAAATTQPKAETSEDIAARLKAMRPDWL